LEIGDKKMKLSKTKNVTIILTIVLLLLCITVPTAQTQELDHIKFNHIFETGGYNFDITQDKDVRKPERLSS
jgi:hypothetical protein